MDKKRYKSMTTKEKFKFNRYLDVIAGTAKLINKNLIDKFIHICTSTEEVQVRFTSKNYMHLCGIYYFGGSKCFFDDCLNAKLILNNICVEVNGSTFLKLNVLSSLRNLKSDDLLLTSNGRFLKLQFEKAIRTKKQICALTLINNHNVYYPNSLLNLKQKSCFPEGDIINSIFTTDKENNTKILYTHNL